MQVTETLNEGLKHEFKVNVSASDLDAKADAKLVDMKDKVRLNGFRQGKVKRVVTAGDRDLAHRDPVETVRHAGDVAHGNVRERV